MGDGSVNGLVDGCGKDRWIVRWVGWWVADSLANNYQITLLGKGLVTLVLFFHWNADHVIAS